MPTIPQARVLAEQFSSKDKEVAALAQLLKKIEERTDNGYLEITLNDQTQLSVPAFVVYNVYVDLKTEKEVELAALADQFDGK